MKIQEIFNLMIDKEYYTSYEYGNGCQFMCNALDNAFIMGTISESDKKKADSHISSFLKDLKNRIGEESFGCETLYMHLRLLGIDEGIKSLQMKIYRNWSNRNKILKELDV